jgi:hypothetical protein
MFSFFRRRKEADATARRIIDQGRFLIAVATLVLLTPIGKPSGLDGLTG